VNQPYFRAETPNFQDLPWDHSLSEWPRISDRLEQVQRGLSRHPVVFVNYSGTLYAIKELPPGRAEKEFALLSQMEVHRLPCVTPFGHMEMLTPHGSSSFLFTRYLESSIPYRSLFMHSQLDRYRESLLDAMAGLLTQLHLSGVFWGDCSLSNTLFRRDAGALQAYLVDAETAEINPTRLSPVMRHHDLEIMVENVENDLVDLETLGLLTPNFPVTETGTTILERYRRLWEEITREQIINPEERYRIQERIRALNALGFSVREVEIHDSDQGGKLRLRIFVTDRNYHRDLLLELTGVNAGEMQARQMINEINELRAYQSQTNNQSIPLSSVACDWLENYYQPMQHKLQNLPRRSLGEAPTDSAELYCQVLEHKWFLSEQAHRDVGHQAATDDYLKQFS